MARYSLSEQAARDIDKIYEYSILTFGLGQARKYYDGLVGHLDFISQNPTAYRIRYEIGDGIRVSRYQSHVVIYQAFEDMAFILRVRHGRENWLSSDNGNQDVVSWP